MRSSVALGLIVCGTIFALAPSISDYLHGYQVAQFLTDRTIQSGITKIHTPFGETYRASAWVLGAAMIGLGSFAGGRQHEKSALIPAIAEGSRDMLAKDDWRQYERVRTLNS